MEQTSVNLTCPGCGGGLDPVAKYCDYCGRPVVIRSFTSVYDATPQELNKLALSSKKYAEDHPDDPEISQLNFSAASCFLKLKLYDKAIESFEKAIADNFDYADAYFYAAIALLRGKRPFVIPHNDIKKVIEYLNAATMVEPKGIYYYLLSYVKKDFYEKKFLKISPNSQEELSAAVMNNVTQEDIRMLFELLGQPATEI